ncbi:MAG TPA: transporter [Rikenellaceae bacterium]|nr:transporter [Rikenellaceae bacterium]
MAKIVKFIKDWMLPLAIIMGCASYLILFFVNPLAQSVEPGFSRFAKDVQPVFMATMLFLQFNTISPHDLRFRKWHFIVLAFQLVMFAGLTWMVAILPDGDIRILVECAMLCFICPTAAAAGVITKKLGGSLSDTVSYVVLANISAAVIIPVAIPIVNPDTGVSFIEEFSAICARVFPLLVLPLLLAWLIRYTMKRLQRWLMRFADWAFYFWGLALTFSIYLATRSLMNSGISVWTAMMIGVISLVCTIIQFAVGRLAGRKANRTTDRQAVKADEITAGQALGQKNSGFLIWLGYSYMTPVTSVAGGLYSIWQNVINSLELYEEGHHAGKSTKKP